MASTYDLVAASCAWVGSVTLIIFELLALIEPVPFGSRVILPSDILKVTATVTLPVVVIVSIY